MAEGLLKHKIDKLGLNFEVDSAGTGDWHVGEAPDLRAINYMNSKGIDISTQRARQFNIKDFEKFDVILTMDKDNYSNVLVLAENEAHRNKVKMILNFSNPDSFQSVPDPYFGGEEGFELVYNLLDEALDKFLEQN
jgi:protein-tyrosine phosphatase